MEPGPSPFAPDKVLTMCPEYTCREMVARGGIEPAPVDDGKPGNNVWSRRELDHGERCAGVFLWRLRPAQTRKAPSGAFECLVARGGIEPAPVDDRKPGNNVWSRRELDHGERCAGVFLWRLRPAQTRKAPSGAFECLVARGGIEPAPVDDRKPGNNVWSRREFDHGERYAGVFLWRLRPAQTRKAPSGAFECLVARGGIEPPTRGFSVRCSTN